MIIDRKVAVPIIPLSIAELRKRCLDCKNCTGICKDVVHMGLLPDILKSQKEARL